MKLNKKFLVLLACVTLLLTFTVGGTVAFLAAGSGPVVNQFTPTEVKTDIDEDFENKVKSRVVIENKGTIPVYVRVALIGNWVKKVDNVEVIVEPYTVPNFTLGKNWVKHTTDGYYYYTQAVAVGGTTSDLLDSDITAPIREDGSYLPESGL